MKVTIQDVPDVTVQLSQQQTRVLANILLNADDNLFAGSKDQSDCRVFVELRQAFSQLKAIMPTALVYFK